MIQKLIAILARNGFIIYRKPYQLNIIGIRNSETTSDKFDDQLYVIFKDDKNKWVKAVYTITTDPGTYWLNHPLQVDGTAILKQGQYVNAYRIGLHKGQYKALVQSKPVTVLRDYDRNAVLDFNNGRESTGLFGVNIHRASIHGVTKKVGKWSAGCQVFEKNEAFIQFMQLCERHKSKYGNLFTYTLIDLRSIKRQTKRWIAYGVTGAVSLTAAIYFLKKHFSKNT